jgi:hypothetical protein
LVINRIGKLGNSGRRLSLNAGQKTTVAVERAGIRQMLMRQFYKHSNHGRVTMNEAEAVGGKRWEWPEEKGMKANKDRTMVGGIKIMVMVETSAGEMW